MVGIPSSARVSMNDTIKNRLSEMIEITFSRYLKNRENNLSPDQYSVCSVLGCMVCIVMPTALDSNERLHSEVGLKQERESLDMVQSAYGNARRAVNASNGEHSAIIS